MSAPVAIAFVTNQVFTTIFTYVAQQLDSALPHDTIWLFSCVTSGLATLWPQSDARRGFGFARENGFVKKSGEAGRGTADEANRGTFASDGEGRPIMKNRVCGLVEQLAGGSPLPANRIATATRPTACISP